MAERRMFSKSIIDTDLFVQMPQTARLLYYEIAIRADDDGFLGSPIKTQRMIGCSDEDMRLLFAKGYIIPFQSGVVVVSHWKIHNYIRKDTYNETIYKAEKELLGIDENGAYYLKSSSELLESNESVTNPSRRGDDFADDPWTQVRLGKGRLGKDRLGKVNNLLEKSEPDKELTLKAKEKKHIYGEYANILLTDSELEKLKTEFSGDWQSRIENLSQGIELKNYKYKSHYLAIKRWAEREITNGFCGNNKKSSQCTEKPKLYGTQL